MKNRFYKLILVMVVIVAAALSFYGLYYSINANDYELYDENDTYRLAVDDYAADSFATEWIESHSIEDKVAQLFIITTEDYEKGFSVGGVVFFSKDLINRNQTRGLLTKYQNEIRKSSGAVPFLAVDEEGGTVSRIASNRKFGIDDPGNMSDFAKNNDSSSALKLGYYIGGYLKNLGFNMNLAPVADVYSNDKNEVVRYRSFGNDPYDVGLMAECEMQGMLLSGIMPVVKHFPGHGSTTDDTHNGVARSSFTIDELLYGDLIPFGMCVEGDAQVVMVGEMSFPYILGDDTPACMSDYMINTLLRDTLNFDGVIMTDALNMEAITSNYSSAAAAIDAIGAGCDILLMPYDYEEAYEGLLNAVKLGTITEDRIDDSVYRILYCKYIMENEL